MTIDFNIIQPQKTPAVLGEVDWEGGLSGLPTTTKKTLLVGQMTSAATIAAGVVKAITSVTKAKEYWGEGSELAHMAQAFLDIAPRAPLYGVSYADGGGSVAASQTVTLASTAGAAGTLRVWVAGKLYQVGIASGDTPTVAGDALVAKLAEYDNLPFTAANSTGTVTFTARCKGTQGNTLRIRCEITAGITMTATAGGATFASGATDGDPTSVMTGVEGDRYHLIAFNGEDATRLAVLSAHTEKQSTPSVQKWGIGVVGFTGTQANAITLATGDDSYRSQVFWLKNSDQPCWELAARFAACRALRAANKGLDGVVVKGITAPSDETAWPTASEIEGALEDGVTPAQPMRNGDVKIVRSIITRDTAPVSFIDHNKAEIADYMMEYLINLYTNRMQGRPLKSASPPGTATTVTPDRATVLLNEGLMTLDRLDYLEGVQDSIDAGNNFAEINATDPNRVDVAFDFNPVDLAHVIAMKATYIQM